MRCYSPVPAFKPDAGGCIIFAEKAGYRPIEIRCGQCIGCRLDRSRQWAIRCMHEAQLHADSVFITLTYDDDHLPVDHSLRYVDFQLFMKRLRFHFRSERQRIRFFMCGEYGDHFGRPHYHACLFGCFFADRVLFKRLASGSNLYTSDVLSSLWPLGHSSIGDVTFESAAYVARYCVKKVTGVGADEHYKFCDENGEFFWRQPEFAHMSLKPGIGAKWFEKYHAEVYPRDHVIVGGQKLKPPKFYDKLLAADAALSWIGDDVEYTRYLAGLESREDSTPDRLRVQEVVTRARMSFKLRTLE